MTTTTDRAEVFTDEQLARAKALDTARGVLVTKVGFASGEVNVPVAEIVDLAEYIITGAHPLDRYDEAAPAAVTTVVNVAGGPAQAEEGYGVQTLRQFVDGEPGEFVPASDPRAESLEAARADD
jgi:hypothetical protein